MKATSRRFRRFLHRGPAIVYVKVDTPIAPAPIVNVSPASVTVPPKSRAERWQDGLTAVASLLGVVLGAWGVWYAAVGVDVANASLGVAKTALKEQVEGGKEQQTTLEGSRAALNRVVGATQSQVNLLNHAASAAEAQHQILDRSLQASKDLLKLNQDRDEQERQRLARKPNLQLGLGFEMPPGSGNVVPVWEQNISKDGVHGLCGRNKDGETAFSFMVQNVGDNLAAQPRMQVEAEPKTILLKRKGDLFNPTDGHSANVHLADIPPNTVMTEPFRYDFVARLPQDIKDFRVSVLLWTATTRTKLDVHFRDLLSCDPAVGH